MRTRLTETHLSKQLSTNSLYILNDDESTKSDEITSRKKLCYDLQYIVRALLSGEQAQNRSYSFSTTRTSDLHSATTVGIKIVEKKRCVNGEKMSDGKEVKRAVEWKVRTSPGAASYPPPPLPCPRLASRSPFLALPFASPLSSSLLIFLEIFETQAGLISMDASEIYMELGREWLQPRHYEEIIDERVADGKCGYPLCRQPLQSSQKSIRGLLSNSMDLEGMKNYCSSNCYERGQRYLKSLDDSSPFTRRAVSMLDLSQHAEGMLFFSSLAWNKMIFSRI
jgi:hypothetical protein